jgi:hypothetical protein
MIQANVDKYQRHGKAVINHASKNSVKGILFDSNKQDFDVLGL